jgi:hypothetical protein
MAKVDEPRLEAIVSQQIELAKSYDSQDRQKDREKALDYYFGNMDKYIPVEVGKSKVVSRDTADTIGWILPGIMRVFTASDRMAVAEPVGIEDVEFSKEATDGLNYVFWKENKGYEIVYSATWDALLMGNGVVKTYYDDTPVYSTSFHSGLSEDAMAMLLYSEEEDEAPEVLAQSMKMEPIADDMGNMTEVPVYDLKIKRKKEDGRFVCEVIPPERFLIDQDAISTDEAAFTAHWERKTRSELVEMGYDKNLVAEIPESSRNQTPEESARSLLNPANEPDSSMQLVDYYECFIRIDVDDDGEAELVRACFAGSESGKLLDWEIWEDEHPFDDIPCEPIPHRWSARSAFDETSDVQDIKTVLLRQGLNNTYAANNPQRFVTGKIKNMDELVTPTFGGTVFGDVGSTVTDISVPFVASHAFEAIAYQDEVIQRRTGVSRRSMALDGDALQQQTATASNNDKDASYSQVELIARNMAEWGWKKVFRKLLRLMIKNQNRERDLMINGKSVKIDPRYWNADMDVTINVGLGTGSRDRDLAMLGNILGTQQIMADKFMAAGAVEDAIDMLPKILQTMVKMAESAGIKNPEDYYPEYTEEKLQKLKQMADQKAQQGDPKVAADTAKMQADLQMAQQKMQADMQMRQEEMQMTGQLKQAEMQAQSEQRQMDMQIKREQLQAEMQLKREQLSAELELKREQMMAELQLKREMGYVGASVKASAGGTSEVRMGGEPG